MQEITKAELLPKVRLTHVKTTKFKTGCLSISFLTQLDKKTASKNALLPYVLSRGTSQCKDIVSLERRMNDLYGTVVKCYVRKKGENHAFGFYCEFPDDDFLPKNEKVLEKAALLLGEILTSPNTSGGLLNSSYVESEKQNLINKIRSTINDKISYSSKRLMEEMCRNEAYSVSPTGTEASAAAITPMALTKHYKKLLSSADINVFYCGSAEFTRVKDALLDAFSSISRTGENNVIYTDIVLYPKRKEPVISREYMDVSQAKLAMGFRMGDAMISPNYPALNVFNSVYGGCLTSKLFLNVRERLSLAYYASSAIDQHKGIMRVLSGIEESNFNKAYDEILLQLDDIKAGNISDEELTGAKLAVITSLKSSCDSLFSLENLYYDLMLSGIELSPEDLSVLAAAVTKEELVKIAAGIKLDTTYLLSGNRG